MLASASTELTTVPLRLMLAATVPIRLMSAGTEPAIVPLVLHVGVHWHRAGYHPTRGSVYICQHRDGYIDPLGVMLVSAGTKPVIVSLEVNVGVLWHRASNRPASGAKKIRHLANYQELLHANLEKAVTCNSNKKSF